MRTPPRLSRGAGLLFLKPRVIERRGQSCSQRPPDGRRSIASSVRAREFREFDEVAAYSVRPYTQLLDRRIETVNPEKVERPKDFAPAASQPPNAAKKSCRAADRRLSPPFDRRADRV